MNFEEYGVVQEVFIRREIIVTDELCATIMILNWCIITGSVSTNKIETEIKHLPQTYLDYAPQKISLTELCVGHLKIDVILISSDS